MEETLTELYKLISIIMGISYLPQIYTLIYDKTRAKAFSLLTLALWFFSTIGIFAYAVVVNGDANFIFYAGINLAGCAALFFLAIYNRYFKHVEIPELVDQPIIEN